MSKTQGKRLQNSTHPVRKSESKSHVVPTIKNAYFYVLFVGDSKAIIGANNGWALREKQKQAFPLAIHVPAVNAVRTITL